MLPFRLPCENPFANMVVTVRARMCDYIPLFYGGAITYPCIDRDAGIVNLC